MLTILTVFAALLKNVPAGCKDNLSHNPPLNFHTLNCFTFEDNPKQPLKDNLCRFDALVFHLYGNKKSGRRNIQNFQFVHY